VRERATNFAIGSVLVAIASIAAAEAAEPGGAVLYRRYCASCHGAGGHGDGPAAAAMCPPPTNLTRIQREERELMALIAGRRPVRAHGSSAMPIWGVVFEESLIETPHARRTALLRLQELARYVRTLRASKPTSERPPSAP
jgi:mono/diheme cytochrome c family protein